MNNIHERIACFKTFRIANTIIDKALKENIEINFVELNYLIFLVYAKLLYININSELLIESFFKTSKGPFLESLASYFDMPYEPITDYIYFDKSFKVFFIPSEYEWGQVFYSKLDEIWELYKYKYAVTLEIEIKEKYPSVCTIEGNEQINSNDILNDEIRIQKSKLHNTKQRKRNLL